LHRGHEGRDPQSGAASLQVAYPRPGHRRAACGRMTSPTPSDPQGANYGTEFRYRHPGSPGSLGAVGAASDCGTIRAREATSTGGCSTRQARGPIQSTQQTSCSSECSSWLPERAECRGRRSTRQRSNQEPTNTEMKGQAVTERPCNPERP
jgi:hypothetical protein